MKRTRRKYEQAALVAVRKTRQIVLFWARRCRKSTTLGSIAFDEMSRERGRTVIAASASLILGRELVGMTLSATEQAAIVAGEAGAVRGVFEAGAAEKGLDLKVANSETDKLLTGLTAEDFAALYKSSNLEMRLYFDRTAYSRLKVIAPNPATARGWGGTVLRDEAGYTPAGLEHDLRVATKPIMDTDKTFKLVYASNLCPNDRHPFFELTLPPPDLTFTPNEKGHFYRGQGGILVHRVDLADSYAAGNVLFDDAGQPLTYDAFRARPENRLGWQINYGLVHEAGGTAAVELLALLTAQRRGAGACCFVFEQGPADFQRAMFLLRGNLGSGRVGVGFDVASTTGETSNPSSITVMEEHAGLLWQRLVLVFKDKHRAGMVERLEQILAAIAERPGGSPARRVCIDASNERLAAEETAHDLAGRAPVELVLAGAGLTLPGREATNYKTHLGDLYCAAINENRMCLPAEAYLKADHRLVMKDSGRYLCEPDADGRHGDTFDSGKLALWGLTSQGGLVSADGISVGYQSRGARFLPHRL